jgi:hypothetical protein
VIQIPASRAIPRLVLILLVVAAVPSLRAAEDRWDKHMKAGEKAFERGMSDIEGTLFGKQDRHSARDFADAEKEFLSALELT